MSDRQTTPEPERDARLARAIREAEGPPPSAARLELLRARIAAGTATALERRERAWWEWTTHWARTEVALAAAAAILAAVIGGGATIGGRGDALPDSTVAAITSASAPAGRARVDSVVSRALAVGASSEQVMNALVGPANGEWLLGETVAR